MKHLNEIPDLWLKRARGFKMALSLCLKEWEFGLNLFKNGIINKIIFERDYSYLIEPINNLTFTAIELYLRYFLHKNGRSWEDTKKVMGNGKHDLEKLWEESCKFEPAFKKKPFSNIPMLAGSTKNFSGSRYPESGSASSIFDLELLLRIDDLVS